MVKTLTAAQAAEWIADGDAVMLGGFIGSVVPEAIERAIGERFERSGKPQDLTCCLPPGRAMVKPRGESYCAGRVGPPRDWRPLGLGAQAASAGSQ